MSPDKSRAADADELSDVPGTLRGLDCTLGRWRTGGRRNERPPVDSGAFCCPVSRRGRGDSNFRDGSDSFTRVGDVDAEAGADDGAEPNGEERAFPAVNASPAIANPPPSLSSSLLSLSLSLSEALRFFVVVLVTVACVDRGFPTDAWDEPGAWAL